MSYENQNCLYCNKELEVKDAEDVSLGICYCEDCDKTYELEWDIAWNGTDEYHYWWLTEVKHQVFKKDGKIINSK